MGAKMAAPNVAKLLIASIEGYLKVQPVRPLICRRFLDHIFFLVWLQLKYATTASCNDDAVNTFYEHVIPAVKKVTTQFTTVMEYFKEK